MSEFVDFTYRNHIDDHPERFALLACFVVELFRLYVNHYNAVYSIQGQSHG